MGFQQGLSGLNSSSQALDVIGNNVSNSGTMGFKAARAQFADVYAASLSGAGGSSQVGIGNRINSVAQQFSQGNITSTNNSLDVAINGNGFFVMADQSGALSYSRNGQFQLNKDGYLVDADGLNVQGYPANFTVNSLGVINSTTPSSVFIDPKDLQPQQTSKATIGVNLDARAQVPAAGHEVFNPTDPTSYNSSTSLPVYDSLGNQHTLSMYFIFDNTDIVAGQQISNWRVRYAIDGVANPTAAYPVPAPNPASPWTVSTAVPTIVNGTALPSSGTLTSGAYVANAADGGGTLSFTVDGALASVTIPAGTYATATDVVNAINLAGGVAGATVQLDPADPTNSTIQVVSNSSGVTSTVAVNSSAFATAVLGSTPFASGDNLRLQFDTSGKLVGYNGAAGALGPLLPAPTLSIDLNAVAGTPNKAQAPLVLGSMDFTGSTQFGTLFSPNTLTQDGYPSGRLTGISVSQDGIIQGRYTNGQTRNMAQLVLARFTNPNGLQSNGNNQWQETFASGVPLIGAPGAGSNGLLQSSALEESTVDLTKELVDMITFQRSYQANAQTIKTQDSILQTITNLR